jgi:hypothetical protein
VSVCGGMACAMIAWRIGLVYDTRLVYNTRGYFAYQPSHHARRRPGLLSINAEQMRILDQDLMRRVCDSIADDLFNFNPKAVVGRSWSRVARRCLEAFHEGRGIGLSDQADLYGFVLLSFLVGADFYRHAAFDEILRGSTVADGRKMLVVVDALLEFARKRSLKQNESTGSETGLRTT